MFRFKRLTWFVASLLMVCLSSCACPWTVPATSTIESVTPDVLRASEQGTFAVLSPGSPQPLNDRDRVSTSPQGEGRLKFPCAWLRIYRDSNLQLQEISVNGANLTGAKGSLVLNTQCASLKVSSGGEPPEAVVEMHGTAVFFAFDPGRHVTLLVVEAGMATLTNLRPDGGVGATVTVPAGNASVVRARNAPEPPRPIVEMGPIIDEMNLRGVYGRAIEALRSDGIRSIELPMPEPTRAPAPTAAPPPRVP